MTDRTMTQTNSDFIAEDLRQMLQAPNYTQWIFSFMQPYLGRRILEIGAGIGALTQKFVQHADFVCGLEPNPACCAY
jgi:16S rRNA A1518/A1519 N6-dimethyltransferase RsmA/KsgA/DIM1 with predicted DNA glycosylase/AP lyase activity